MKVVPLLYVSLMLASTSLFDPRALAQDTPPTPDPTKMAAPNLTSPHLIKQVVPSFPGIAKFEQLDGKVIVRITVAADGTVKKVKITHGLPQLVPSATHAVAQWIYEPCRSNGVPTQCETTATIDFDLEKLNSVAGGMPPQQTSVTVTVPPEVRSTPVLPASIAANTAPAAASAPIPPPPPGVMRISSRVMATYLDKKVEPVYPSGAVGEVEGAVVMLAIIGKTGDVIDVQIVSGPEPLRSSAADAVKQWKYRPYLIDGQPMEVQTTIALNSAPLPAPVTTPPSSNQVGVVRTTPKLIHQVDPVYPREALAAKIRGAVVVTMTVNTSGMPENLNAVSGPDLLRAAALDAVSQYRFSPMLLDGKPAKFAMYVTVTFN